MIVYECKWWEDRCFAWENSSIPWPVCWPYLTE